jgi:hypothetical protein
MGHAGLTSVYALLPKKKVPLIFNPFFLLQHKSELLQSAMLARSEREFFESEPVYFHWVRLPMMNLIVFPCVYIHMYFLATFQASVLRPDAIIYGFTMANIATIISEALRIPALGFILQVCDTCLHFVAKWKWDFSHCHFTFSFSFLFLSSRLLSLRADILQLFPFQHTQLAGWIAWKRNWLVVVMHTKTSQPTWIKQGFESQTFLCCSGEPRGSESTEAVHGE